VVSLAIEGRSSGPVGLASSMSMGVVAHPNPSLEEKGRKSNSSLGKGDGQKATKDGVTRSGEGLVKGSQKPGQCLPKSSEISEMTIKLEGLASHIQYMKDHALITKFVGIWPPEKALVWWVNNTWKAKGGYDLRLGVKCFFTIIFYNMEDKNRVFEGGPYFYNSTCLYLTFWQKRFNPEKEDLSVAPAWLQFYSLPSEFWRPEILEDIGNALGAFVKVAE